MGTVFERIIELVWETLVFMGGSSPVHRAHVGLKLLSSAIIIASMIFFGDLSSRCLLLSYPLVLLVFSGDRGLVSRCIMVSSIPALILFVVALAVSPQSPFSSESLTRAFSLAVMVLGISVTGIVTTAFTHPGELASMLARLRLRRLSDHAIMIARVIPLTLRDTSEALAAGSLLGKPAHRMLLPVTATALMRAEKLAETLYLKGYGVSSKRTPWREHGSIIYGMILLVLALGLSMCCVLISIAL